MQYSAPYMAEEIFAQLRAAKLRPEQEDCAENTKEADYARTVPECNTTAQGGWVCNLHGGGSRCEIPNCTTNTYRNRRCKKHKHTPMPTEELVAQYDREQGGMLETAGQSAQR